MKKRLFFNECDQIVIGNLLKGAYVASISKRTDSRFLTRVNRQGCCNGTNNSGIMVCCNM
jgi:hypothetical protein